MKNPRRLCQARPFYKGQATPLLLLLLPTVVLLLTSTRTLAQPSCNPTTQTEAIRVENATGVAVLQAAVNCTGGEVEVIWAGRVRVGAPITVAEGTSLTVTGEGDVAEVDGRGSQTNGARLFQVSPGGSLILAQLKLSGGSAGGGGAVCSQSASLTLDGCVFDGNVATDGSGGAVLAEGGNVTIVGGEFLHNSATGYGGAVHAIDGRLVVQGGTRFEGNTAIGGGALYCGLGELAGATPAICSILDAEFVSNSAAREDQEGVSDSDLSYLDGGGAAMFLSASVDITGSEFRGNNAKLSGGAVHGGVYANISVNGCTFVNNESNKYGGAVSASTMTLGGGTLLANNVAFDDGGAVFGWDAHGTIVFNDVLCKNNTASNNGGCFHGAGRGIVNDGTAMQNNSAVHGGSILAAEGCDIRVSGGNFSGASSARGGFIYAEDDTRVRITGGLIEHNHASKRGGALNCLGNRASYILIEGGTFRNNKAVESGGAIAVWGDPGLVTITGGTFENNKALFYGGFAFVEAGASLKCEGATVRGNHAGDQGGGIYARLATWVNSTCDLIENTSLQGAAIYLTNVHSARFENHSVAENRASGGSVAYVAVSSVVARNVTFITCDHQDHTSNRAIQMDERTTLDAKRCVFDGWPGDAVIFNTNSANGSLILDSCDFSGSSAVLAVLSPNSDAEIRNAVVSNFTFANAVPGTAEYPLMLVDRALNCSNSNACGAGECVDTALGVLCECLESGECLNGGGELSLSLETAPEVETFNPDPVSYQLKVSSASAGTTYAIWDLAIEAHDLSLDVYPSSGVLPPGGSVTVQVTGTPSIKQEVGGNLTSTFVLNSVGSPTAGSTPVDRQVVNETLYLCKSYEYASPPDNDDVDGIQCKQCSTITGDVGVDCEDPGATKAFLPILQGYWRSSNDSLVVLECLHSAACGGAKEIQTADDYCADGYKGPYCAVCTNNYGRGVSNECHSCANTSLLLATGTIFSVVIIFLLVFAVVFLIGGLDAIDTVHQSLTRSFSEVGNRTDSRNAIASPAFGFVLTRKTTCQIGPRVNPLDETVVPRFSVGPQVERCVSSSGSDLPDGMNQTRVGPLGVPDGVGIPLPDLASGRFPGNENVSTHSISQRLAAAGGALGGPRAGGGVDVESTNAGTSRGGGFGKTAKHWISILPLDKLKILVVVWQILAVGSSITGVEFPAPYSSFLSWISVVNLDLANVFSASCLLPSVNFYVRLLVTTLSPLVLAAVLVLTYHLAKHRAGIGSAGVIARRAAWSRHVAAGLLLTFLVFTSASSVVFKTFACNDEAVKGESYLREDYSISCGTLYHRLFEIYAGLMILVYPIGIPVVYATILWKNRELLNPRINIRPCSSGMGATTDGSAGKDDAEIAIPSTTSKGKAKTLFSFQQLQELEARVEARRKHPELVPSMFLWKDFGPDLYYYEVIECGRRILLTGVLIFIAPQSPSQVAMACIFAFASLLGFELMRPHMDPADSWLYRLGCVIIFLSNFLALLIKVDAGEVESRAMFGGTLVAINVLLVLAVFVTSWFAVQQSVDESRGDDSTLNIAQAMLTAEQYAAESARLSRSTRAPVPTAFFSDRTGVRPFDRAGVTIGPSAFHERHRSGATDVAASESSMPGVTGSEGVNAAIMDRLQHQSQLRGGPRSEEC